MRARLWNYLRLTLNFKKKSFSYLWTKFWNSLPSQVRVSRDVNDFKSKLQDCSILEGVLQFSCHVFSYLIVLFSLGFSFLYFMYLLLVFIYLLSCLKMEWYYLLAVTTIDLIYTRSYFERVRSSCLFPTNANKVFSLMNKIRNSKPTGVDRISVRLIRECTDLICVPICDLFNDSFRQGKLPKD